MKRCSLCGGTDHPVHRYGEASIYSSTPGKPIYACNSCDPITPAMNREDLKALQDEVADRSDGNPGAINVMCAGILFHGRKFYDRLAHHGLRGSKIFIVYKDLCEGDFEKTLARLESDEPFDFTKEPIHE